VSQERAESKESQSIKKSPRQAETAVRKGDETAVKEKTEKRRTGDLYSRAIENEKTPLTQTIASRGARAREGCGKRSTEKIRKQLKKTRTTAAITVRRNLRKKKAARN